MERIGGGQGGEGGGEGGSGSGATAMAGGEEVRVLEALAAAR